MNVEDLRKVFKSKILEKNEVLFKEGDIDGQGYIIESGKISLIKKNIRVEILGPGEVLGVWKVLFENEERFFTASAEEKTSVIDFGRSVPRPFINRSHLTLGNTSSGMFSCPRNQWVLSGKAQSVGSCVLATGSVVNIISKVANNSLRGLLLPSGAKKKFLLSASLIQSLFWGSKCSNSCQ